MRPRDEHADLWREPEAPPPPPGPMLILQTVQRKLNRSLHQRGVGGTLRRALAAPGRYIVDRLRRVTPSGRRAEREERAYDRLHGVDTYQDDDLGWMAKIQSPNWKHGAAYQPAPADVVTNTLATLAIPYEEFVFIDFGSGKGRPLLLAAQFPFKRIIGVEYSPDLHATALENIAAFSHSDRQCDDIEAVCQDATDFAIPPDPGVYFFHHPFDEPVFRTVVQRMEISLAESPRRALVIYYDPRCRDLFERSNVFERREMSNEEALQGSRGRYGHPKLVVYEARPPLGT